MKKYLCLSMALAMVAALFVGCGCVNRNVSDNTDGIITDNTTSVPAVTDMIPEIETEIPTHTTVPATHNTEATTNPTENTTGMSNPSETTVPNGTGETGPSGNGGTANPMP